MNKNSLKQQAIAQTLFPHTNLKQTLESLGFIQADPIRSPARAQDLILRHRVKNYKVGDLEKNYPTLDIDEDHLYAYGFVTRELKQQLYPRTINTLTVFDKKVLRIIQENDRMHPKELEQHFGKERVINAWGGHSKATKTSLEKLHYHGCLRISHREKGIRVYQYVEPQAATESPLERKKRIVMSVLNILAPVAEKTLSNSLHYMRYFLGETKTAVNELVKSGEVVREKIDGIMYLWPASQSIGLNESEEVRFLTPFDPIVWDRIRFEHLWDWQYRFEAYTPKEKRTRGFYAMPLLWRDEVIGWANIAQKEGGLDVELGFVDKRPKDKKFEQELEREIENMKVFLQKSDH